MHPLERSIIHLNIADFAVAVERIKDPLLSKKPLIIAPFGNSRTMVYDMSEEAFQAGVRKGMKLQTAKRLCRDATIKPPQFSLYRRAMSAFFKEATSYTPLIEQGNDDGHIFLDITGTHKLFGPPPDIGYRLQKEVRNRLSLNPIWTLATNKLTAKVASRLVKPFGEYIVEAGDEQNFLAPLPIAILPELTAGEKATMYDYNVIRVSQLASLSRQQLMIPFGKRAGIIHELAKGIDRQQITSFKKKEKQLNREHLFPEDTNNLRNVEGAVALEAARLGAILRKNQRTARRIAINILYTDGTNAIRQATRKKHTDSDFILIELGLLALKRAWTRRTRICGFNLSCDLFRRSSPQLTLFETSSPSAVKHQQLTKALDIIRERHGHNSILTGLQKQTPHQ